LFDFRASHDPDVDPFDGHVEVGQVESDAHVPAPVAALQHKVPVVFARRYLWHLQKPML